MKLEAALKYMNAEAPALDPALREREVGSFAIDSRVVEPGSVFFALSQPEYRNNGFNGEFEDSTKYVRSALESGAMAFVARSDRFQAHELGDFSDKAIFVDDAIVALQKLAHGIYEQWNKPVVGITGSAGKTTAKEFTAHVLSSSGLKILRNKKNYNNGLGHPLTVLQLVQNPGYDAAVLEMGMSTPMHEIERLCGITPPDISVVLNVLPVHLEYLGSIENIAKAKAEIVDGMKVGGTAVLNADDLRVAAMRELSRGRTITYGLHAKADVMAIQIRNDGLGATSFSLEASRQRAQVNFPLNGMHNISNALAAASVGIAFGMDVDDVAAALCSVRSPEQRGEVLNFRGGFTVVDDSYNSNPTALLSMVQTVAGQAARRTIIVAGEMLELGPDEVAIHRKTGKSIGESGVDVLIAVRGLARELAAGAAEAGLSDSRFVESSEEAGEILTSMVREGDLVLVKGSRGVKTEKVVERLLEKYQLEGTVSRQN